MNSVPNKQDAIVLTDRLMEVVIAYRRELADRDPEGRSLNLGVTMFFGVALSWIREFDDKRLMCDAAMGYSFQVHDIMKDRGQHL